MAGLQPSALDRLISLCGTTHINCHKFMRYLGLPVIENKGRAGGTIRFDDETGQIQKFYEESVAVSKELAHSYKTTVDLRANLLPMTQGSLKDITSDILSRYGSAIWSTSEPFLTRNGGGCPRLLVYEYHEDLERIRTSVYHWIVHRAIRRFVEIKQRAGQTSVTNKSSSKISGAGKSANCVDISDSEDTDTDTDTDVDTGIVCEFDKAQAVTSRTVRRLAREDRIAESQINDERARSQSTSGRPTARISDFFQQPQNMTRAKSVQNSHGIESLRPGQRANNGVDSTQRQTISEAQTHFASLEAGGRLGYSSSKRRDLSLYQESSERIKRPRSSRSEARDMESRRELLFTGRALSPSEDDSTIEVVRKDLLKRYNVHKEDQMRLSNVPQPTRPDSQPTAVSAQDNDSVQGENDDDLHYHEHLVTQTTRPNEGLQMMQNVDEPIVPDPHFSSRASCSKETLAQQPPPSAVTQDYHRQRSSRGDRGQLASKLLDLLETPKFWTQDMKSIEDTTELITRIAKADADRLEDALGGEFERHYDTLAGWLECINAFLYFRQTASFRGSRGDWLPFYNSLSTEKKQSARKAFIDAQAVISTWCEKDDVFVDRVSEDLASALFNITATSWANMMDLPEMKRLCATFNEALLSWFS